MVYRGASEVKFYKIIHTFVWFVRGLVSESSFKLSKDEAKKVLEELMAEGVNPDELRAIPD